MNLLPLFSQALHSRKPERVTQQITGSAMKPVNYKHLTSATAILPVAVALLLSGCSSGSDSNSNSQQASSRFIEASPQREGDAAAGWEYLRYGDLLGSGLPAGLFAPLLNDSANLLNRDGDSATIPVTFNIATDVNGVRLLSGLTCLGCHSGFINGEFIPGLGSTDTGAFAGGVPNLSVLLPAVEALYGVNSVEALAAAQFITGTGVTAKYTSAPIRGLNTAFILEEAAIAHRNPQTLAWLDEPQFNAADFGYASDVPPLWLAKKKNALYYNAMGRGDFSRLILQVFTPTVLNLETAERIIANGPDILAWINALEAPVFPSTIDTELAAMGQNLFTQHCESCHGRYGADEYYPNVLVGLEEVGTDPHYAQHFLDYDDLSRWYNASWYSQGSSLQPSAAYIAPPLDGIWASAPYFHNGSVPTLLAVLDPGERPMVWKRSFDSRDYDWDKLGWNFIHSNNDDPDAYDTSRQGYSNQGHLYGEVLSSAQQLALLEYLKTL
jgi:mono/diheme cytochrome c family protein